ncbi:MAG: hypothetical protein EAZ39_04575 [Oscillatoriales cyanobacterium]|nr:MAG: hypothetical protein EAZ88_10080 [Oscillatoriales cyanobacterium]TAE66587.1 MAG: hypothetical protein EAZ86_20025 [Oscillatoriales cyanobacterium]TAG01150.1 MAG: hypothetical protein EAZ45_13870 [Oscillatoriales cyanobacterium]TAG21486.1 MAG: hypothetical protein EAZ39_04575 [Oscillatoriales cyanobacterium]TAG34532.1 MAG: hypothetical protein EAZ33_27365 [Oscillatoriales cyanobacterium]
MITLLDNYDIIIVFALTTHPMKDKNLHIRLSEKRLNKLRAVATAREQTITQMIEMWIDRLSLTFND